MPLYAPGSSIARYHILGHLATGGMAEVYLVRHALPSGFKKVLVLKVILPQLAENAEFVQMFNNEANLAALLNHPNVVQVFDFGVDDARHFMAMEYIDGLSLNLIQRTLKAQRGRFPVGVALRIVADACGALHYAHTLTDAQGVPLQIIHRDVSRSNILLTYTGQVKLVDFGIAKARTVESYTREGMLRGKYPYMAPEIIAGEEIDFQVDVYALSVVLYRLLLGVMPFEAKNHAQLLHQIANGAPRSPRQVDPQLAPELERVLLRALARDPARRYPSAAALQAELEDLMGRGPATHSYHLAQFMTQRFPTGSDPTRETYQHLAGAQTPSADKSSSNQDAAMTSELPTRIVPSPAGPEAEAFPPGPTVVVDKPVEEQPAFPPGPTVIEPQPTGPDGDAEATFPPGPTLVVPQPVAGGGATDDDVFPPGPTVVAKAPAGRGGEQDAFPQGPTLVTPEPVTPEPAPQETWERSAAAVQAVETEANTAALVPGPTRVLPPAAQRPLYPQQPITTTDVQPRPQRRRWIPMAAGFVGVGLVAGVALLVLLREPALLATPPAQAPDAAVVGVITAAPVGEAPAPTPDAAARGEVVPAAPDAAARAVRAPRSSKGRLWIRVRPWAAVLLDGKPVGSTPLSPLPVKAGSHTVTLKNQKLGVTREVQVQVKPGRLTQVRVDLTQ